MREIINVLGNICENNNIICVILIIEGLIMELFKIVTDKEELKKRCLEVETPISEELKTLLLKMIDYLKKSQDDDFAKEHDVRPGVGLAANQIGYNQRFLAIYLIDDHGKEIKYGLVNPVITTYSVQESYISNGEGCLSVKEDVPGYVYRHAKITVRALSSTNLNRYASSESI